MADQIDIYLKEYEQLRQELIHRINLAYALITLDLTVLGAGLTVFQTFPGVVVGLAVASSFLWLFFIDHASQVYKIAAYTALHLGPALRVTAPAAMRWEDFLRELDAGGARAVAALYDNRPGPAPRGWIVAGGPSGYLAMLFGSSPPILLLAFAASSGMSGSPTEMLLRILILVASLSIWVMAIIRFRHFKRTVGSINEAISTRYREDRSATAAAAAAAPAASAASTAKGAPAASAAGP